VVGHATACRDLSVGHATTKGTCKVASQEMLVRIRGITLDYAQWLIVLVHACLDFLPAWFWRSGASMREVLLEMGSSCAVHRVTSIQQRKGIGTIYGRGEFPGGWGEAGALH
jgi:hypothetical protein